MLAHRIRTLIVFVLLVLLCFVLSSGAARAQDAVAQVSSAGPSAAAASAEIAPQPTEPTPAQAEPTPVPSYPPLPIDLSPGPEPVASAFGTEGLSYQDASIQVQIYQDRVFDTPTLYAHIKIKDASQLRTAAATNFKSQGTTTAASIAKRNRAVVAINGDNFNFDSKGYVFRQGVLYRSRPTGEDVLLIDDQGDFYVVIAADAAAIDQTTQKITQAGRTVINGFTFGPVLVADGKALELNAPEYFDISPKVFAQRVAIAQLGPLEYLLVSTGGPEDKDSKGLTIPQMAEYVAQVGLKLHPQGCRYAFNLDGGSSNTLYFNGQKINSPGGKSRMVNDIVYFATLVR